MCTCLFILKNAVFISHESMNLTLMIITQMAAAQQIGCLQVSQRGKTRLEHNLITMMLQWLLAHSETQNNSWTQMHAYLTV
jgi:hypothetical protein